MRSSLVARGHGTAQLPKRTRCSRRSCGRRLVARVVAEQESDQTGLTGSPSAVNDGVPGTSPFPAPATPDPAAQSQAIYPPAGYPYQMPVQQRMQQEYYMAAPPLGYYPAAPPPVYRAQETSGLPWWIWVGVGIIAANVINKVQDFMRNPKTPQQLMTEMAMKQMMGAMGGPAGATSPFGKAGMPPFPMGGFPPPPAGSGAAPSTTTVDIPASSPMNPTARATTNGNGDSGKKGDRFASRLAGSPGATNPAAATPGGRDASPPGAASFSTATDTQTSSNTTPTSSPSSSASFMDVVEPIVKEPAFPSSSSSSSRSSATFFADAANSSPSSSASPSSSSGGGGGRQQQQAAGGDSAAAGNGGGAGGAGSGSVMMHMMESMLRSPDMQRMLYPYLPEPMRNPQSIEWMLSNPEVKAQMAAMFEQQNIMSPQMMDMMKNMDFSQEKVNQQFETLGVKPEDVITKVMSNPELAAGFQNPKVQAAIMDISQNPMNVMKYQGDPEIMRVLEQVTTMFQADVQAAQR